MRSRSESASRGALVGSAALQGVFQQGSAGLLVEVELPQSVPQLVSADAEKGRGAGAVALGSLQGLIDQITLDFF